MSAELDVLVDNFHYLSYVIQIQDVKEIVNSWVIKQSMSEVFDENPNITVVSFSIVVRLGHVEL